jgi:small subunit ribosomal protein S5
MDDKNEKLNNQSEDKKTDENKAPAVVLDNADTASNEQSPKQKTGERKDSKFSGRPFKKRKRDDRFSKGEKDEFEQKIIHIARVTRVMKGGKRMRFRACVAVGNKAGKVGIGLAKSADVTAAITKAVDQAKKKIVNVQIIKGTIAHELNHKFGAAKVMLKPTKQGTGIIAGGSVRIILELAGIKNIVGKILGTNNPVNNVKCTVEALASLKHVDVPNNQPKIGNKNLQKDGEDKDNKKNI